MEIKIIDRDGKEVEEILLDILGLRRLYTRIETAWVDDVAEALAALAETRSKCRWEREEERWVCTGKGPTDYCPPFEAILSREGDKWSAVIKLDASREDIQLHAIAVLLDEVRKLRHKVDSLRARVVQLESALENLQREREGEEG